MKNESPTHPADRDKAVKRSVSIPQSLVAAAERLASADGRTLSNYITRLIQQDVESSEEPSAKGAAVAAH